MRFSEAEKTYRELEDKLIRGDLAEDDFLVQVAQLRLVDEGGRRWMLSARSGRWLVHDGQQWVFAQPPREDDKAEAVPAAQEAKPERLATTSVAGARRQPPIQPATERRTATPRILAMSVLGLLLIGCLVGGGISAWVFLLRDLNNTTPESTDAPIAALVET